VVRDVEFAELLAADELFLCNSVFGLWPVNRFEQCRWVNFEFVPKIRGALAPDI
jgi:4-amino-4-deoxychorismate lyase